MPDDNKILRDTLKLEGGLTKDKKTNFGMEQVTFDNILKQRGLPSRSVETLTQPEVSQLYDEEFFQRPKINLLPKELQQNVFDFGVHSSPKRAIQFLQRIVGAKDDGIIGPNTLGSVQSFVDTYGAEALNEEIEKQRLQFLNELIEKRPDLQDKSEGLINRVKRLKIMRKDETP